LNYRAVKTEELLGNSRIPSNGLEAELESGEMAQKPLR
jgi:hypothetical protein